MPLCKVISENLITVIGMFSAGLTLSLIPQITYMYMVHPQFRLPPVVYNVEKKGFAVVLCVSAAGEKLLAHCIFKERGGNLAQGLVIT